MREIRLLTDEQMRFYVVNGFISVKTALPPEFHAGVFQRTNDIFEKEGNPGNNLLPRLPEVQRVFQDPNVAGALTGLLGADYYMHPHRHCHCNPPGSDGQRMHMDGWNRRHHHTRWAMAFYYPQHTPKRLGPTGVVPGSHFNNTCDANANEELPLCGDAGDVTIVHYDLWHRAMPNASDGPRYMMKFLFTRMHEPDAPSWRQSGNGGPARGGWKRTDDRALLWNHLWDWHRGRPCANGLDASVADAARDLGDGHENTALNAAYRLAAIGTSAIPTLSDFLDDGSESVRLNAAYALSAIGAPAVPTLVDRLAHDAAQAVRILADIGGAAEAAVRRLVDTLEHEDPEVRRWSAEALGNIARAEPAVVPGLKKQLKDDDGDVRRTAALALAKLGPAAEAAVSDLRDVLADANRYARGNAAEALRRIGTPAALHALIPALTTARWCPDTTPESTF
ncbi:MAG: HEAT repeat domain-containing protein [Gemmatimonadota bacterium]|nr:HEAT repeat domain-containing protein [Gemmatimonadota bacterium]